LYSAIGRFCSAALRYHSAASTGFARTGVPFSNALPTLFWARA
jgi:hypothetical protein